jgi:hypothetical protein
MVMIAFPRRGDGLARTRRRLERELKMKKSGFLTLYCGALAATAFAAPAAMAQEAEHYVCQVVGNPSREPLGDHQGHALTMEVDSCRAVDGPMAGGVMTTTSIWEWDGPKAKLISTGGIGRKPGATTAFHSVDGSVELILSDGKVTGADASGHSLIDVATGSAAPAQGKTITWTSKATGPDTFEISDTVQ